MALSKPTNSRKKQKGIFEKRGGERASIVTENGPEVQNRLLILILIVRFRKRNSLPIT